MAWAASEGEEELEEEREGVEPFCWWESLGSSSNDEWISSLNVEALDMPCLLLYAIFSFASTTRKREISQKQAEVYDYHSTST